jgi:hypothetical protein
MLISYRKRSDWDLQNELGKVSVRWFLILTVSAYFYYLLKNNVSGDALFNTLNYHYVGGLILTNIILNLWFHLFLSRRRSSNMGISAAFKYASMIFDLIVITLLLLPTGGKESMFFLLYLIVILSNGIRYGMRLSIIGLLVFNFLYVAVLFYQFYPDLTIPSFQKEVLKIIGIWFVGIYTGYLSRRFEILHNEVEKYKLMIQKMEAKSENEK